MLRTKLILAVAALGIAAPAIAQTTTTTTTSGGEFFVVRDATTKRCTIVNERPTGSTTTIVSEGGTVYKTRTEAEAGLKTTKVCTDN